MRSILAAAAALAISWPSAAQDVHRAHRDAMVQLIADRGVKDSATLRALRIVPRHQFVQPGDEDLAYGDHPLPIGHGQTISQPYIVGYMTELLQPRRGMKVLEVGTGSGYQAAVLVETGCDVYTVEIVAPLAAAAKQRLARLGYGSAKLRHADGHNGWPEAAPFEAIIVTAAAGYIPPALLTQLAPGGRMLIPVGAVYGVQYLVQVDKDSKGRVKTKQLLPVRFVPLIAGSPSQ